MILLKILKNLQLIAIAGIDKETYPDYIRKFESECLAAVKELEGESEEGERLNGEQ